jgi:hypothetical protein
MVFETTVAMEPADVLEKAKTFFATRDPRMGAFLEHESAHHVGLRGQGGEEVVIAVAPAEGGTKVRGSSLLFCQQVKRFLASLPPLEGAVERVA